MKHFELEWEDFLDAMTPWTALPVSARQAFLHRVDVALMDASALGKDLAPLSQAGVLIPSKDGSRVRLAEEYRPVRRALRAMQRHPLFDEPTLRALTIYIREHFTREEEYELHGSHSNTLRLAKWASSPRWIEEFDRLHARAVKEWCLWACPVIDIGDDDEDGDSSRGEAEDDDLSRGESDAGAVYDVEADHEEDAYDELAALEVFRTIRELIALLRDAPGPLEFREIIDSFGANEVDVLGPAIRIGLRFLLFFPALREDLEPILGLWPEIHTHFRPETTRSPQPVSPVQSFGHPYLLDDMTNVLVACANEPLRLRNDLGVYARDVQALVERAMPLPDWLPDDFEPLPDLRVDLGTQWASLYGYVQVVERDEPWRNGTRKRPCLVPTEAGTRWLRRDEKGRLRALLDALRPTPENRKRWQDRYHRGVTLFPFQAYGVLDYNECVGALAATFGRLQESRFFGVDEFAAFQARTDNPLLNTGSGRNLLRWRHREVSDGELRRLWEEVLLGFIANRLLPLGGARIAIEDGRTCFAITSIGRYLIGAADDFEHDTTHAGDVIVQPNFEIVFLAPNPTAEARIGGFAERKGQGAGTLFKLTKRAIFNASAAGLTAESVLTTLAETSAKAVPKNVAREIRGWFGQCRRVTARAAVLLHCPDPETAARVAAAGGKRTRLLTDTVVELNEEAYKNRLLRKLQGLGIFGE